MQMCSSSSVLSFDGGSFVIMVNHDVRIGGWYMCFCFHHGGNRCIL